MKRVLNISILLISIFMCCTIGYATDNPNSDGYYDFEFRTSRLGQYKIELTATETPFYETLPLDKVPGLYDKFPTSTLTGYTEVDNTEPSARYGTPIPKIKVDVAFATGAMGDQMDAFQNSIAELEAKLRDSRNNLDVKIQYVETSTISSNDSGAKEIFTKWENYPDQTGQWTFDAATNSMGSTQNVSWTGFWNNSADALQTTDIEIEYKTKETIRVANQAPINYPNIMCHPDPMGFTFKMTYENGKYSYYAFVIYAYQGVAILARVNDTPSPNSATTNLVTGWTSTIPKAIGVKSGYVTQLAFVNVDYNPLLEHTQKIICKGNNITIEYDGKEIINYTDTSSEALTHGGYGPFTYSMPNATFFDIIITTGGTQTLVQATTDVNWRDDAHRFIIHSTDEVPQELQPGHDSEFTELISYLNSGNIFLFNLGIDAVNKDEFNRLDEALIDAQGNPRSKYLRNYPIKERMLQAAQEIIDMLKQFQTESEWILVDSDINWRVVEWADFEQDVPLNFGEHDGTGRYGDIDKQVSLDWGVSLTHLWTQPKILAEKWRFRHFEDYFDNNLGKVNYNGAWIEDAPTSFSKTGKYRINYQRKDNPFHTDVRLSSVFDMYRKWSTNYNDN